MAYKEDVEARYYADQEISFRLKELGFNDICNAYYDSNGKFKLKHNVSNSDTANCNCVAPLYHQVINWIKDNTQCDINAWSLDNVQILLMQIKPFLK